MWNALGGGNDAIICKVIATQGSAYGGLTNMLCIADVEQKKHHFVKKRRATQRIC